MRTIHQVAEEVGLTSSTIRQKCLKLGIEMKKRPHVDRKGAVQEMLVIADVDARKITEYYKAARGPTEESSGLDHLDSLTMRRRIESPIARRGSRANAPKASNSKNPHEANGLPH